MPFNIHGRDYTYRVGSDVERDGMYLEITNTPDDDDVLFEIFYSDQTHQMTVTFCKSDIPLEVVEWAISEAKERLLPIRTE